MRSISLLTGTTSRFVLILGAALIGLSTAAMAQGCGPSNPNCIVPTAPTGTCNNQAASTAFVCGSMTSPKPCGVDTEIQYNKAGACGADANLTWDYTDQILTVNGDVVLPTLPTSDPDVTGALWNYNDVVVLSGFTGFPPSAPCGSDTDVQYNNMGACGADGNLTWNYTSQILSIGVPEGTGVIQADTLQAFNAPSGSGFSGDDINIFAGLADPTLSTGGGGSLGMYANNGNALGVGGGITISAGNGIAGGETLIYGGTGGGDGGGAIALFAGSDGEGGPGGNVEIEAGTGTPNGNVQITGLPTSDPGGTCVGVGCIWSFHKAVVLSGFTPQYATPQDYDPLCGTGGHDCTAAIVSCGTSGSLCYVPCGSYNVTSANLRGHAVKVSGAGYCSNIILTNTTDTGILVGNSSASYLSGVVVRDLHFTAAAAQSAGAGLEITYCSNCSFERLWFDGGNLFDGVAINNSTQVALNSVQIYNCLDDGVRFYSIVGLLIDADSFAGGCTANGFHATGNAAGIEINGTGLLNTANGFFCDKADIATANGQFFFGSFSDFDTNGMWGLNFGTGCIASGGADGFMFHGWASSNATGGIAISAQGGIYATIVGAQILGNGQSTSGHGVFYDDSGAGSIITLTGNTIAFNGAYAALFSAQPNVGIINGNATYNTTGSFSGFVPSGSLLICTANAGQASIGAGC